MYRIISIDGCFIEYEFEPPRCDVVRGIMRCVNEAEAVRRLDKMVDAWQHRQGVVSNKIPTRSNRVNVDGLSHKGKGGSGLVTPRQKQKNGKGHWSSK